MRSIKSFLTDEQGVTVVEYGLLLCMLTLALIGAWTMIGDALGAGFNTLAELVKR